MPQPDLGSSVWLNGLTRVARALGRDSFEKELFDLLNQALPVDHCAVFTYGAAGVGHLFTHGKMPSATARQLADDYVKFYHGRDPMFAELAASGGTPDSLYHPLELPQGYDAAYRNHFFDRNDLIDKASTVGRVEAGSVLCNFYRMAGSGLYSRDDWARLELVLPLVTSLISAHFELVNRAALPTGGTQNRGRARSLVHTIVGKRTPPFDRLTDRERQVCERILLGYTSLGIGLDLGIGLASVLTYRKRAYEKLAIAAQNELFALCLQAIQRS